MSFALKGHLARLKSIEIRHLVQLSSLENPTCGFSIALETISSNMSSVVLSCSSEICLSIASLKNKFAEFYEISVIFGLK